MYGFLIEGSNIEAANPTNCANNDYMSSPNCDSSISVFENQTPVEEPQYRWLDDYGWL